jgi:hypothetical protein
MGLAATAVSAFANIPTYKGLNPLQEQLKSLLTLAVGMCFFLTAAAWPVSERRLRWTLVLINVSGLVMIAWSLAQSGAWYGFHRYPAWMRTVQEFFSVGPLYRQRTAGFTLEPSWLAHQLNMVYLPIWLAASVKRFSAHRRILGISLENGLLVCGVGVLALTLSRVGLLAFLLAVGYLLVRANLLLARWIRKRIAHSSEDGSQGQPQRQRLAQAGIFAGLLGAYGVVLAGVALIVARVDPRMQTMFTISFGKDGLMQYANQLAFATRVVYWQAGWDIFSRFPVLGVGLGNAGFYFPQSLPAFAWKLMEVHGLAYRSGMLMNIKSIWVRVLAETGIVGFALFCSWVVVVWVSARSAGAERNPMLSTLGLAGQLMLMAFLLEGFSVDSFALPYVWITAGLVSAAAGAGRPSEARVPAGEAVNKPPDLLGNRKVHDEESHS